jgi:type II secretory pathway component PulL
MKLNRRRVAALAIVAAVVCVSVTNFVIWRMERVMDSSRLESERIEEKDLGATVAQTVTYQ